MKRIVTAVVGAGLVVAAVGVARAISGEDSTPDAQAPTSSPTQPVDVSREFDPDLAKEQIKKQSEQLRQAQTQMKEKVDELARLDLERQERERSE